MIVMLTVFITKIGNPLERKAAVNCAAKTVYNVLECGKSR